MLRTTALHCLRTEAFVLDTRKAGVCLLPEVGPGVGRVNVSWFSSPLLGMIKVIET